MLATFVKALSGLFLRLIRFCACIKAISPEGPLLNLKVVRIWNTKIFCGSIMLAVSIRISQVGETWSTGLVHEGKKILFSFCRILVING